MVESWSKNEYLGWVWLCACQCQCQNELMKSITATHLTPNYWLILEIKLWPDHSAYGWRREAIEVRNSEKWVKAELDGTRQNKMKLVVLERADSGIDGFGGSWFRNVQHRETGCDLTKSPRHFLTSLPRYLIAFVHVPLWDLEMVCCMCRCGFGIKIIFTSPLNHLTTHIPTHSHSQILTTHPGLNRVSIDASRFIPRPLQSIETHTWGNEVPK